jgi:hypothetical protein
MGWTYPYTAKTFHYVAFVYLAPLLKNSKIGLEENIKTAGL